MRIGCIIQARINSTRLPNKANADIGGWPMWRHVFERMKPFNPIIAWAHDYPDVDEMDLLGRYALCAKANRFDIIMRVTSDCPLIDPEECRKVLNRVLLHDFDYAANDMVQTYPDGLGCEVMKREALLWGEHWITDPEDREHVRVKASKRFSKTNVLCPFVGYEKLKFSVDTQAELDLVRKIDAALPAGDGKYRLENTLEAYRRVQDQARIS